MQTSPSQQLDHLINLLGAFITTIGDDLTRALEDEVGAGGAGPAALLALDTWPHRSIDFLAGVLGLSHSGTVRLVDRLEDEGLVERRPGVDGRTAALRLTTPGRKLARRARGARHRLLSGVVDELSEAERRTLRGALDRVLRNGSRSRVEAQRCCRLCDHSACRGQACPIGMSAGADLTS